MVFAERVAKQLAGIGVSGSAIFGAEKVAKLLAGPGPITLSVPPEWLRLLEQAEIRTERGLVIPTHLLRPWSSAISSWISSRP